MTAMPSIAHLRGTIDRAELALRVREHVIRMTRGGGCFLGASLLQNRRSADCMHIC